MKLSALELSQSAKSICEYSQLKFLITQTKESLGIENDQDFVLPESVSVKTYIEESQKALQQIELLVNCICLSVTKITPEIDRWKYILPDDKGNILCKAQDFIASFLKHGNEDLTQNQAIKYIETGNTLYEETSFIGDKLIHDIPQFANADIFSNEAFNLLKQCNQLTDKDIKCLITYVEQESDLNYIEGPIPLPPHLEPNLPIIRAICTRTAEITEETEGNFRVILEAV